MIAFSVCIELAFAEAGRSMPDRVRAAADAGFRAVEIWDWRDKPLPEFKRALRQAGVELHTLCVEHWRDKCQLADPDAHDEFVRRVRETAAMAVDLGCPKLVVLAGDAQDGTARTAQLAIAGDALTRASDAVAGLPVELLLEVVNRKDEGPNALVQGSAAALDLIRRLDRPNLRYLYDRYHAILNGEALGEAVAADMSLVGHVQVADIPGRHELGTGAHDWVRELAWLAGAGYQGYIGIEAIPLAPSETLHASAQALLQKALAQTG